MAQDLERELLEKETVLTIEASIPTALCVSAIAITIPYLIEEIWHGHTADAICSPRIISAIIILVLAFFISLYAIHFRRKLHDDILALRKQLRDIEAKKSKCSNDYTCTKCCSMPRCCRFR